MPYLYKIELETPTSPNLGAFHKKPEYYVGDEIPNTIIGAKRINDRSKSLYCISSKQMIALFTTPCEVGYSTIITMCSPTELSVLFAEQDPRLSEQLSKVTESADNLEKFYFNESLLQNFQSAHEIMAFDILSRSIYTSNEKLFLLLPDLIPVTNQQQLAQYSHEQLETNIEKNYLTPEEISYVKLISEIISRLLSYLAIVQLKPEMIADIMDRTSDYICLLKSLDREIVKSKNDISYVDHNVLQDWMGHSDLGALTYIIKWLGYNTPHLVTKEIFSLLCKNSNMCSKLHHWLKGWHYEKHRDLKKMSPYELSILLHYFDSFDCLYEIWGLLNTSAGYDFQIYNKPDLQEKNEAIRKIFFENIDLFLGKIQELHSIIKSLHKKKILDEFRLEMIIQNKHKISFICNVLFIYDVLDMPFEDIYADICNVELSETSDLDMARVSIDYVFSRLGIQHHIKLTTIAPSPYCFYMARLVIVLGSFQLLNQNVISTLLNVDPDYIHDASNMLIKLRQRGYSSEAIACAVLNTNNINKFTELSHRFDIDSYNNDVNSYPYINEKDMIQLINHGDMAYNLLHLFKFFADLNFISEDIKKIMFENSYKLDGFRKITNETAIKDKTTLTQLLQLCITYSEYIDESFIKNWNYFKLEYPELETLQNFSLFIRDPKLFDKFTQLENKRINLTLTQSSMNKIISCLDPSDEESWQNLADRVSSSRRKNRKHGIYSIKLSAEESERIIDEVIKSNEKEAEFTISSEFVDGSDKNRIDNMDIQKPNAEIRKVWFTNDILWEGKHYTMSHYIMIDRELTDLESNQLKLLLSSFPHCNTDWIEGFINLDLNDYSGEIVHMAANAYDDRGNTVLGIAAENGHSVEALQKLIDHGAKLDTPDDILNKLALHWAIGNKLSWDDRSSIESASVVQCLLDNGASLDIKCYQGKTPLEYAISRGYTAAEQLIRDAIFKRVNDKKTEFAAILLLHNYIPPELAVLVAKFLNGSDGNRIARTSKSIFYRVRDETRNCVGNLLDSNSITNNL